jgi:hypothetical protein
LGIGLKLPLQGRDGKGFFGLTVVQVGRKLGIVVTYLVQEPGMESDGVVRGEDAICGGGKAKGKADKFGVLTPVCFW